MRNEAIKSVEYNGSKDMITMCSKRGDKVIISIEQGKMIAESIKDYLIQE